ncbi:MAG TPA: hypothetical protein VJJ51_02445 [Candidatus Methanoperedens sp.]|nr:hypothetical protein [Candidatus Methanoperedens sp.]HLB69884.1 hypothetical protein [Candidatus Methanoperedens sp.]
MRIFNKRLNIKVAMVLVILVLNVPASANTTISLDNTIDTPDRTVTYQGKNYEVQDIGSYLLGQAVNISVNVTDIESFQLSLLDSDKEFLWNYMVYYTEGQVEVTMPGNVVTTPGTYAFAIFYQGDILVFKPVVFSRYELSVIPESTTVAPGATLHVTARVVPDDGQPMKVVLAKNSSSLEYAVNRTREGLYETEIKIPSSASGRFSLYAAMESEKTAQGYPELLGVSNCVIINITDSPRSAVPSTSFVHISMVIISVFFATLIFKKARC